jgi:hypothetical protein
MLANAASRYGRCYLGEPGIHIVDANGMVRLGTRSVSSPDPSHVCSGPSHLRPSGLSSSMDYIPLIRPISGEAVPSCIVFGPLTINYVEMVYM